MSLCVCQQVLQLHLLQKCSAEKPCTQFVSYAAGTFGWPPISPGFAGGANMADVMNKPLSEVLRQLEQEFNAAAQQARQRQNTNSSSGGGGGGGYSAGSSNAMRLPVDTIEDAEAYWFFIDLPGLEKKDVQVSDEAHKQCAQMHFHLTFLSCSAPALPRCTVGRPTDVSCDCNHDFLQFRYSVDMFGYS